MAFEISIFKIHTVIATSGIVGLAEWIIDDTSLVLFILA